MTLYPPEQQVIPNVKNTSSFIAQARCAHCGEPCLPNEEQKPAFYRKIELLRRKFGRE